MHHVEEEIAQLNDKDFKLFMVKKLDAMAQALHDINNKMIEFRVDYFDGPHRDLIKEIANNEEKIKSKIEKIELDFRTFRAQVLIGATALIGVLEIARQYIFK